VLRFRAPQEHRGELARPSGPDHVQRGHAPQDLEDGGLLRLPDLLLGDDGDRTADFAFGRFQTSRGHDDLVDLSFGGGVRFPGRRDGRRGEQQRQHGRSYSVSVHVPLFLPSKNRWMTNASGTGLLALARPTCRAFPSVPGQWPACGVRRDYSRGAAEASNLLPLIRGVAEFRVSRPVPLPAAARHLLPPAKKNPRAFERPGDAVFHPHSAPGPRGAETSASRAGLPASGSSFLPRLPIHFMDSGVPAAFVPGYGGGTATDSHRLPY